MLSTIACFSLLIPSALASSFATLNSLIPKSPSLTVSSLLLLLGSISTPTSLQLCLSSSSSSEFGLWPYILRRSELACGPAPSNSSSGSSVPTELVSSLSASEPSLGEAASDSDELSSVMRGPGMGEVSRVLARLEAVSSERVDVSDDCESRRPLAESSLTDSDEADEKTILIRGSGCS